MGYWLPDPRFEMPELFEPRRKPTGQVVHNNNNGISKSTIHTYLFNTFADIEGNNRFSFFGNAGFVMTDCGRGLTFDGTGDYAKTTDVLDFPGDFSIEVKFKSSSTATRRSLLSNYDGTSWFHFEFNGNGSSSAVGTVSFTIDGNPGLKESAFHAGSYNDGKWHTAVGVREGDNIKLYTDGVLVDTEALAAGYAGITSSEPIHFGRIGNFNGFYFNGQLDHVRIINRALSAVEVSELYNHPFGSGDNPLLIPA